MSSEELHLQPDGQNNDGKKENESTTNQEKTESGLEVDFAREYLETKAGVGYYEGINLGTPESFVLAKSKLEPLKKFLPHPKDVVSIGVGAGEEVHAAADLYSGESTTIHGLDLSPRALQLAKERLERYGLQLDLIEGSAIDLPFPDNSIDGFIESAILHEIYSYVPDGKDAWKKGIAEIALKLSEDGSYLLRDFSAPSQTGEVQRTLNSDTARRFYDYFREHYRTFASWEDEDVKDIIDKRNPNDADYPPYDPQSHTTKIPFGRAAEVMLHFRNFFDNYTKGMTHYGDPHWKEINESYLPPNPNRPDIQAMSRDEYVATVLTEANQALADTDYEMVCVQNESSTRPETAKFLADHFAVQLEGSQMGNDELLSEVTQKMELVFRKVRKQLDYDSDGLHIAETVAEKGKINVVTPNGLNLTLEKGVFIPDSDSFEFVQVGEDLISAAEPIETIADVGTGSGLVAISLARAFKDKTVLGYDISPNALILAQQNAQQNNVAKITFLPNQQSEWISSTTPVKIDFIVSNPPYLSDDELSSPSLAQEYPDYQYQPESAIRSYDKEGVAPYASILEAAQAHGTKHILFRVNPDRVDNLITVLTAKAQMNIRKIQAKNGKEEFLSITLP